MSITLVKLTAEIVSSHATGTSMTSDDLVKEIEKVFSTLKGLEAGETVAGSGEVPAAGPAMSFKKAFRADEVNCMICGKSGFKTLTRHLRQAHDLKPGQYRKQFNIPSNQSLTAKNYSEARRQAANENNLAANLEKARAVRAAKKAPPAAVKQVAESVTPVSASKSAKAVKAARKPSTTKTPKE